MRTITVTASSSYDIIIGDGLYEQLGAYAASVGKTCKAAVISDDNVWSLYGKTIEISLRSNGFETVSYCFPAGESSKNADTYLAILNFLAANHLTRSDVLVALGGGVVGDITGFAAATYLRGISYIQVPTTLLAMVDSSVGGKTAIDLPAGKNLAGAFYQPSLVLCDISSLNTLPVDTFRDGCAEVIKYSILYDPSLFNHLHSKGLSFDREAVISRCIELKRDVVESDEFDRGARQRLNLGHTIGHGVEASSNFTVSHGQGVAIGMAIVARAARSLGLCDTDTCESIHAVIDRFGLPGHTPTDAKTLYTYALSDKKRSGKTVNLIIPKAIGNCIIYPTAVKELQSIIEAGL